MERYGKQFRELDRKEKLGFIWDYYKFHIAGAILVMVLLGSLFNHFVLNPPKQIIADITVTAPYVNPEELKKLEVEMVQLVESQYEDKTATVEVLYFSDQNDPQTKMIMATKLISKISAGQSLILVLDKDNLESLTNQQALIPLQEYLKQEELEKYSAHIYSAEGKDLAVKIPIQSRIAKLLPKDSEAYLALSGQPKDLTIVRQITEQFLAIQ